MARKLDRGNTIYDLLIDLIMNLSPYQADRLYGELLPKYTKRSKVHLYNAEGVEDKDNGKVRLMPLQYQTIRMQFGDTYVTKAFTELTNYIKFLEDNIDSADYKSKLNRYVKGTHNEVLTRGWVFEKCKNYIIKDRPKINLNPYEIEDFNTAKTYIEHIPLELRRTALDVKMLIIKFPELASYLQE